MITVLPPSYFGPISYFSQVAGNKVVLDCFGRFQKQTIRNRSEILGANGKIRLTVPLIKWSTKVPINEIQINNSSNWKHVHWMSIQSAYRNSAFFEHYEEYIQTFFNEDHNRLINLNVSSINLILRLLNSDTKIEVLEEPTEFNSEKFSNLTAHFAKKRTAIVPPGYTQVFSDRFDFTPDLSVLDLIFNLGPRASIYLQDLDRNSYT